MTVKEIWDNNKELLNKKVEVDGWIRNHRKQKDFGFIDLSDGTCFKHVQVVYDNDLANYEEVNKFLVGCSIHIEGTIVKSSGNQEFEIKASKIELLGNCPEDYPIQPKRHTKEF